MNKMLEFSRPLVTDECVTNAGTDLMELSCKFVWCRRQQKL